MLHLPSCWQVGGCSRELRPFGLFQVFRVSCCNLPWQLLLALLGRLQLISLLPRWGLISLLILGLMLPGRHAFKGETGRIAGKLSESKGLSIDQLS